MRSVRKLFALPVLAVTGLVLGLSFVSCNRSGAAKDAVVTIRYFTWTAEQIDGIRATVKEFEQANPKIKVDVQTAPWDQYWQKMQTEVAGGNAADVFMNQTWYFKTLQAANAAVPLDEWIARDNVSLANHNQKVVAIYTENGKLYAMPQDWDAICIVYNKDMFDKYGVPYPDENLSWNPQNGGSFIELAKRMTVDSKGNNGLSPNFDRNNIATFGFVLENSNNVGYWNFMRMNGGDILTFNDPRSVEAIQFLQDTMYKYYVAPQQAAVQSMGSGAMFASGTVAMHLNGNWALGDLEKQCNFNWQVAMLPSGPKGRSTIVNGIGQSVFTGSQHKEEAWQFVKWLGGARSQQILAQTGTVFPSTNTYWPEYIKFWADKGRDISPFQKEFDTADTFIAPLVPKWNEKDASVHKNIDLVFMNRISAKEAGDNIAADFAAIGN
ncbi:MAG: sugar ABC transporter substrate-binding protein [Treponema sp.]|nr:sugar ABC transporter substrate-binding protein [Treponema sp.]